MRFRFPRQRSDPGAPGGGRHLLRRLRAWRQSRRLGPGLARAVRRRARMRLARTGGGGFGPDQASRASLVWGATIVIALVFAVMLTAALRPRVVARPAVAVGAGRP